MSTDLIEAVAQVARHCYRKVHWKRTSKGPVCIHQPLAKQHLAGHLNGGAAIGLAPIVPGTSTTRVAVLDFDSHKGEVPWPAMAAVAARVARALEAEGLAPAAVRSSGGMGIHLLMFWDEEQDAYSVRVLLRDALHECGLKAGTKGVAKGEVEVFPKQDEVASDGYGNMFVLPYAGKSVRLDADMRPTAHGPWPISASVPVVERPPKPAPKLVDVNAPELQQLRKALDAVPNNDLDYDQWRNVIFSIHHATGGSEDGHALASEWSAKSTKHDQQFLDERVWPYVRDEREGSTITGQHVLNLAHAAGWDEDIRDAFPVIDQAPSSTQAIPATKPKPASRFAPRSVADHIHATRNVSWVIESVFPEAELAMIVGETKAGKSFLALDLGASVARGIRWRNNATHKGKVAYVIAEGAGGFGRRLDAYLKQNNLGVNDLNDLVIYPHQPNLTKRSDIEDLRRQLHADGPYRMVIVDTLAATTTGANENSGEDMGAVLAHCKGLHLIGGHPLVVLVHHVGKDATKGPRGWSGIEGAADAVITVQRADHLRTATLTKLKEGEDGAVYPFTLTVVHLGESDSGRAITSCTIGHQQLDERASPRGRKLGDIEQVMMDIARIYCHPSWDGDPLGPDALLAETVERFAEKYGETKRKDNVRRTFQRLVNDRFLVLAHGVVTLGKYA